MFNSLQAIDKKRKGCPELSFQVSPASKNHSYLNPLYLVNLHQYIFYKLGIDNNIFRLQQISSV